MKNVVITGGSKGIGKGCAREFLKRGHNVAICARTQSTLDDTIAELTQNAFGGARLVGQICDVIDRSQVQALWDTTVREFGRVDIWINNAGRLLANTTLQSLKPQDVKSIVDTNVIGTMNASQVALQGLMGQEDGGHIYLTMGAGHDGAIIPGMIAYGTTKRAIHYFAQSLINETKGTQVRVSTLSPGMNLTEGMLEQIEQAAATLSTPDFRKMLRPINIMGDLVGTTTPWTVEQILEHDSEHGNHLAWMTKGKLCRRFLASMFSNRDLVARVRENESRQTSSV